MGLLLYSIQFSQAGHVRTITLDGRNMKTVYLSLGQSTIVRFPEKPNKVIVGNTNFFNVEFVETDVAIQPKGITNSNLFVYGQERTYGLLLKVKSGRHYDDLVHVRWKESKLTQSSKDKSLGNKINVGDQLWVQLHQLTYIRHHDLYVLHLSVKNVTRRRIRTKDIEASLTRRKKDLPFQPQWIWDKKSIGKGKNVSGRFSFQLKRKEAFTLHLSFKDFTASTIIRKGSL
ncbi:MAG: hypothetical protein KDD48_04325 [Bdellovibrionales bacterium]|nr:hypothetical protein [Bdellovibrionales bacterium]